MFQKNNNKYFCTRNFRNIIFFCKSRTNISHSSTTTITVIKHRQLIHANHSIFIFFCENQIVVLIKNHFKKHKDDLRFPPSWKCLEQVSFGNLSKLYGNLTHKVNSKDSIAQEFGAVNHTYLPSWLQSIAQIRNFCAHHSRLWNRNLPGTVKLLPKPPNPWITDIDNVPKQHEFSKLYVHMCLMKYLLNTIQPNNQFTTRLNDLFIKYPNVDPNALGMKLNWQKEPLWQ